MYRGGGKSKQGEALKRFVGGEAPWDPTGFFERTPVGLSRLRGMGAEMKACSRFDS